MLFTRRYYSETGKLLPLTIIQGFTVGVKPITAYWTGMSVARHAMDLTIKMVSVTPDAVHPSVAYVVCRLYSLLPLPSSLSRSL